MKVIDLLNKIAKGEETPKKIEHGGIWYSRCWSDYMGDEPITDYYYHNVFGSWFSNDNLTLDTEVEIIEEEQDIEELNITERRKREDCYPLTVEIMAKINELIKAVNELKNGSKKNI